MIAKRFYALAPVIVMSLMLTSCAGTKGAVSSESTAVTGGNKILNIASTGEGNVLYPIKMTPEFFTLNRLVYETLFTYEHGRIVPVLAESYELGDDGLTLTLHLRKDVKFHDGTDFNAETAKINIEDIRQGPAAYSLPAIGTYTSLEAVDEYTLKLGYDTPYFGLLTDLCWLACGMVSPAQIQAKASGQEAKPVGTGPYVYTDYEAGEYSRFVRNESYWGQTPYYDEIVSKYIPDSASRMQALKNGEVDLLYGSSELNYDEYNQAIAFEGIDGKVSDAPTRFRNLTLNFNGILRDFSIRQAMAYAINKELISKGVSYGYEPVTNKVITTGGMYEEECPDVNYSYDLDKSKSILEDAGWTDNGGDGIREKDGVRLSLVCTIPSGDESNETIALLLKDMFKEAGIDMNIKILERMDWGKSNADPSGFDLTMQDTYYDYASPAQWFGPFQYMAQGVSLPLLKDSEQIQSMIGEFKTLEDGPRVAEIIRYLSEQDQDQILDIPLTQKVESIVYNKNKIADYTFNGFYQYLNPQWIIPASK